MSFSVVHGLLDRATKRTSYICKKSSNDKTLKPIIRKE